MHLKNLDLMELGWNSYFQAQFAEIAAGNELRASSEPSLDRAADISQTPLRPARVVEELRRFHRVRAEDGEYLAEIAGRMRHLAENREDLPAVGDWVAIAVRPGEGRARIEQVLPRRTKLSRKVAGREQVEQIVAANLDVVFVVSSLNRDFNLRRIERYLTAVWDSGARPVALLNKADLCADAAARMAEVEGIALGAPVHLVSALLGAGIETVRSYLKTGETAALVGSSGVGKSTIINGLTGAQALRVQSVREDDDRGRHTTTSRQMIFLEGGGIVIDTPGMREFSLWESDEGIEQAFEDIASLASGCRFRDCSHRGEPGCEVAAAIQSGRLESERMESYRKLEAELLFQERKRDPRVEREVKERWKKIHKAMRKDKPDRR